MIKLEKLDIDEEEVFKQCIKNMRNIAKYENQKENIIRIMKEYDSIACAQRLHTINQHEVQTLEKKDLIYLYTRKLSQKEVSHAYRYYRQIRGVAEKCPYCLIKEVKQLDHYLPKSDYPIYSITPNNLIPSCKDCNELKKNPDMTDINNHHLHPYYDIFDSHEYIKCKFKVVNNELLAIYNVDKEKTPKELYKKAKVHFELFEISEMYGIRALSYINSHKIQWKVILDKAGEILLKDIFEEGLKDSDIWLTLLYETLEKESELIIDYLKQLVIYS